MNRFFYILIITLSIINDSFAQPELIFDGFKNTFITPAVTGTANFENKLVFNFLDHDKSDIWITDGVQTNNLTIWESDNNFYSPIVIGDSLYFIEGFSGGVNIWKTDGTSQGNEIVWENALIAGISGTQDKLFVFKYDAGFVEMWVQQGSNRTQLLDSIHHNFKWTTHNNQLYLFSNSLGLIRSDGTANGTAIIKPFDSGFFDVSLINSITFNNEVYFTSSTFDSTTIWKTDGITTVNVCSIDNDWGGNFKILGADNQLFIYNTFEIYSFNNNILESLISSTAVNDYIKIFNGKVVNNKAVFVIDFYKKHGTELWVSDGTITGTKLLKEINRQAASGVFDYGAFEVVENHLYFMGNDGKFGQEIWRTDGTTNGTELVYDTTPLGASSEFEYMFSIDSMLYLFRRNVRNSGHEFRNLWKFNVHNFTPQIPHYQQDEKLYSIFTGRKGQLRNLKKDKNNGYYVGISERFSYKGYLFFYDNDHIIPYDESYEGRSIIAKYNDANEVDWVNIIYTDYYADSDFFIQPDEHSNLYVAGHYREFSDYEFGGNYSQHNEEGLLITKLKDDGSVDWNVIGQTEGNFKIVEMFMTNTNELTIIGVFNKMLFQGNIFTGSQTIFLLKINQNGDLISFKNLHQSIFSDIKATLTPDNEIIICETKDNTTFLYKINQQGNIVWSTDFPNEENIEISTIKTNSIGEIFIIGQYYNALQIGYFTYNFPSDGSKKNSFIAKFNEAGEILNIHTDESSVTNNINIIFDENDNYYLIKKVKTETDNFYKNWEQDRFSHQTHLQKFNINGELLNERILFTNINHTYEDIIVNDNHMIYAGMYFQQLDSFANSVPGSDANGEVVFLLDLPLQTAFDSFQPNNVATGIVISPNPLSTYCIIKIHEEKWKNYRLNIYSSNGQLLKSITKENPSNAQSVYVADLPIGLLFFEFDNGHEKVVTEVMKH